MIISFNFIVFVQLKGKRRRSEEASTSKKQCVNQPARSKRIQEILRTRPHEKPKKCVSGERIKLLANYFPLRRETKWSLYKYHVTIEPEVLMARVRNRLLYNHKPTFGGYLFDGTQLFLTRVLDEDKLNLVSTNREGVEHHITLRFTKKIEMDENESLQVLNLILRRAMQGLQMKLVHRNYYDPVAAKNCGNHRIQLWPGYETSIRQHEYDILLNVDVRHKVMRTETVYEVMRKTARSDNFRNEFTQQVLGITVLTDFNNATYRIDDIDFDKSPKDKFSRRGQEISFIDYYKQVWFTFLKHKIGTNFKICLHALIACRDTT